MHLVVSQNPSLAPVEGLGALIRPPRKALEYRREMHPVTRLSLGLEGEHIQNDVHRVFEVCRQPWAVPPRVLRMREVEISTQRRGFVWKKLKAVYLVLIAQVARKLMLIVVILQSLLRSH